MLTYQLQDRILKITEGEGTLEFPSHLTFDVKLGPGEGFGTSHGLSRLAMRGHAMELIYNANTGRVRAILGTPMNPLEVIYRTPTQLIELRGDILHFEGQCKSDAELESCLRSFVHIFPALLNLGFADPPVVLHVQGQIGSNSFRWEHTESIFHCVPRSVKELEEEAANAIDRMNVIQANPRVLASVCYFYTASRLVVSGHTDWEFMAEGILNLCKALQVLFGERMDDVRSGLKELGYPKAVIEGDFVPLMVMRNYFDIGHAQLSILDHAQLQILYRYLSESEGRFRELLTNVTARLAEGTLTLPAADDPRLDKKTQKKWNRLISTISTRVVGSEASEQDARK